MAEYIDYAEYYDADTDYTLDIPFYLEYAQKAGSPALELACGTGRVLMLCLTARLHPGGRLRCFGRSSGKYSLEAGPGGSSHHLRKPTAEAGVRPEPVVGSDCSRPRSVLPTVCTGLRLG